MCEGVVPKYAVWYDDMTSGMRLNYVYQVTCYEPNGFRGTDDTHGWMDGWHGPAWITD